MRILLESSTDSEWVAQQLESLGHDVIVADPELCADVRLAVAQGEDRWPRHGGVVRKRAGWGSSARASGIGGAARRSASSSACGGIWCSCAVGCISLLRALLRQDGWRSPRGSAEAVEARLDAAARCRPALATILAPLRTWLTELNALLATADHAVVRRRAAGSGRAALDDGARRRAGRRADVSGHARRSGRFGGDAARASAFLGLVPSEDSSAERRHKGHITKTGPCELRALLVQASWVIWRGRSAAGAALRAWAHALAARRGRRIAIVRYLRNSRCQVFFLVRPLSASRNSAADW